MNNRNKYIEIAILILVSFSPLLSQPIKAGIILLMLFINIKYFTTFKKNKGMVLFLFLSIFIISFLLDLRNVSSLSQISILNLFFPMCFLLGYIISEKYTLNGFYYILDKVIFVFAALSLLGVFIYTFIPTVVSYLPSYNYYHTTHKTVFIFNILTNSSTGVLQRNAGIAWEPGAFQFLVNLGLYAYLRTTNKTSLLKIAIYLAAVITTKSTAGILILLLITFKLILKDRKLRVLIISSILVFSGLIIDELIYQYKYKLFGSYAFQSRLDPLMNAFNHGRDYFFGMGNSGFDLFYRYENKPPWDAFGQIFIRYGYILLIFIVIRLLTLMKNHKILFAILVITLASQNIWFFPLITPFYFLFKQQVEENLKEHYKSEQKNNVYTSFR